MNFGEALEKLKGGERVARKGWNGKNMFIYLTSESDVPAGKLRSDTLNSIFGEEEVDENRVVKICSHIDMKGEDGSIIIGWLASQTDMQANDWEVV